MRGSGPSPPSERRATLYGVSIDVPLGWRATSPITFTSKADTGLERLVFVEQAVSPADLEEQLRIGLQDANSVARGTTGSIHRLDNPSFTVSALEVESVASSAELWLIAFAFEIDALLVTADCVRECDELVQPIVRTLRRAPDRPPPPEPNLASGGRFLYRAGEFEFESALELDNPWEFVFEAENRDGRMRCSRGDEPEALEGPTWPVDFDIDANSLLSEAPLPVPFSAALFQGQHWLATVDGPGGRRGSPTPRPRPGSKSCHVSVHLPARRPARRVRGALEVDPLEGSQGLADARRVAKSVDFARPRSTVRAMSARELGWVLLGVCSTLGCARGGVAARPEPAKPIAVSVAPPVASAPVEPASSEPPAPPVELGDRMTLYGLSMALPAGWRDQTTPAFESESGMFRKVVITDEPELVGRTEEWLSGTREKMRGFYGAQPGMIRRYEHSELENSAFRVTFPKSAESVHVVVTAGSEQARHWYVICNSNCDVALGDLLRSLHRAKPGATPPLDPASLADGKYVYRAYDWEFETNERLTNPREFWGDAAEEKGASGASARTNRSRSKPRVVVSLQPRRRRGAFAGRRGPSDDRGTRRTRPSRRRSL